MRFPVVALLICIATPGFTQDVTFSDAQITECIDAVGSGETALACIGEAANTCMETTPGGFSTVGIGGCLDRELSFWDARLNVNYRARIADAKNTDLENADAVINVPNQEDALRQMQRAWIEYRDAACTYERSLWGGGSGGLPATLECLMDITAQQALRLERRFGG